jgi:AAA15 family ATPase/GTPase
MGQSAVRKAREIHRKLGENPHLVYFDCVFCGIVAVFRLQVSNWGNFIMLVEFSVSNYRSIRDRQTLSLIASQGAEHREHNTWKIADTELRGLRSAVIYGPNASGKTNLLRALLALQQMVVQSAQGQAGVALPVAPFLLDEATSRAPTEFEIIFYGADGVRYQYGCAVTADRVHREIFTAYPLGRPRTWFERIGSEDADRYSWSFGKHFKGEAAERKVWKEFTRPNALFLSTAIQLNNEQLRPAFNWIAHGLIVAVHRTWLNPGLTLELMGTDTGKRDVSNFLKAADVGIDRMEIREAEGRGASARRLVLGEPQIEIGFEGPDGTRLKQLELLTWHKRADGTEVSWSLDDESEGTKKLFELTGGWLRALRNGATVLVDELDRSLHPHITRFLLRLFHGTHNPRNAQLIFTTHDTTLLDVELMRRDQVWFVEKDRSQTSRLYSLLEFSPRKDEALEAGYLRGRYGAIPFVGSLGFDG